MKFGVILGLFLISSIGRASNLVGTWSYSGRSCASGAIPNSSVPEPHSAVKFTADEMTVSGRTRTTCTYVIGPIKIQVTASRILPMLAKAPRVVSCPSGTSSSDVFNVEFDYAINQDRLTLTTPPADSDYDACPKGDSQMLEFVRVP